MTEPLQNTALSNVRRLHLGRIHYDFHYRVGDAPRRLEILALWHASRGSQPPI